MYSVVLMMALSGGSESVDFGRAKCHGCSGCSGVVASCSGSCHGRARRARCHGCTGACHGRSRCHGCHGCHGVVYAPACCGGTVVPGAPPVKMMPKEKIPTPPAKTETSAPATIVVSLPADARLTVDGNATTSTSERRTLVTPDLEFGSTYVYTLRAEVVRDGRAVVETQEVTVRGGETTNVPFSFSSQSVASR
jgi:uncharacterized protein (TIGR03000 family)